VAASRAVRLVLGLVTVAAVGCGAGSSLEAKDAGPTGAAGNHVRGGVSSMSPSPDPLSGLGLTGPGGIDPRPGVDLVPINVPQFIFGYAITDPSVQPGTLALAGRVHSTSRLAVTALPSPTGTAALDFLELSPPGHRWGELMIPAERALFRAFAANPSLGGALVIVDDVKVLKGTDPVPITAYRWDRAAVEAYARCGIPDRLIESCTDAFYLAAEMLLVRPFRGSLGT